MTIKPGVMACLDDDALLRSIDQEDSVFRSPLELELMRRLSLYASYESDMEQSEFRRHLLHEIRTLCDNNDCRVVKEILLKIENSQLEV